MMLIPRAMSDQFKDRVQNSIEPQVVPIGALKECLGAFDQELKLQAVKLSPENRGAALAESESGLRPSSSEQLIRVINGIPRGKNVWIQLLDDQRDEQFHNFFNKEAGSGGERALITLVGEYVDDGNAMEFRSANYFGQDVVNYAGSVKAILNKLKNARLEGKTLSAEDAQFQSSVKVETTFNLG